MCFTRGHFVITININITIIIIIAIIIYYYYCHHYYYRSNVYRSNFLNVANFPFIGRE